MRDLRIDEPVVARLGPQTGRFGQRVLHVPVAGLTDLAARVVDATARIGEPPETRAFSGHVTLARPRGRARVDLRPLAGTPIDASWPVRSVELVSSVFSPRGSQYEVVEAYGLG